MWASRIGQAHTTELLLNKGADVNMADNVSDS